MTLGPRAEAIADLLGRTDAAPGDAGLVASWLWTLERHATLAGGDHWPIHREGDRTTMFIAMNRFRVKKGSEAGFEEVWLNREIHLHTVPGFVEFHLLAGPSHEDHTLYASHTVWQSEEDFLAWTRSKAFRDAHKGAGGHGDLYLGPPQFEGFTVLQTVARAEAAD